MQVAGILVAAMGIMLAAGSGCVSSVRNDSCPSDSAVYVQAVAEAGRSSPPDVSKTHFTLYELENQTGNSWGTSQIMGTFEADSHGCGRVPVEESGSYRVFASLKGDGCDSWYGAVLFDYDESPAVHNLTLGWQDKCQPLP